MGRRALSAWWRRLSRPCAAAVLTASFLPLAEAQEVRSADASPKDPLTLIASLRAQRIDIYRGRTLIHRSRISTGKAGHETPSGVFSILQKRKWHRSNIYSLAPMPFMQRLTWSGIALHAGHVPNYPASHGCIRMPGRFAKKLFRITEKGAHVVVARGEAAPVEIAHEALFRPAPPPVLLTVPSRSPVTADAALDSATPPSVASAAKVVADHEFDLARRNAYEARSRSPLRILVTRRKGRERMRDVQRLLAELGHDPGPADGYMGPETSIAIQAFQKASGLPASGAFSDSLVDALHKAAGDREIIVGHIYVRQDFEALFDAPLRLREPDRPLGTHIYTAMHFEEGATDVDWLALTPDGNSNTTAREALDRFEIPEAIRKRISMLLTPGSSLIITDNGISRETTRGTDFVILDH
ncbi:MAG: L,D-transpeptidase family protein [Methyloligellaceae bacterium]